MVYLQAIINQRIIPEDLGSDRFRGIVRQQDIMKHGTWRLELDLSSTVTLGMQNILRVTE